MLDSITFKHAAIFASLLIITSCASQYAGTRLVTSLLITQTTKPNSPVRLISIEADKKYVPPATSRLAVGELPAYDEFLSNKPYFVPDQTAKNVQPGRYMMVLSCDGFYVRRQVTLNASRRPHNIQIDCESE